MSVVLHFQVLAILLSEFLNLRLQSRHPLANGLPVHLMEILVNKWKKRWGVFNVWEAVALPSLTEDRLGGDDSVEMDGQLSKSRENGSLLDAQFLI